MSKVQNNLSLYNQSQTTDIHGKENMIKYIMQYLVQTETNKQTNIQLQNIFMYLFSLTEYKSALLMKYNQHAIGTKGAVSK